MKTVSTNKPNVLLGKISSGKVLLLVLGSHAFGTRSDHMKLRSLFILGCKIKHLISISSLGSQNAPDASLLFFPTVNKQSQLYAYD